MAIAVENAGRAAMHCGWFLPGKKKTQIYIRQVIAYPSQNG